MVFISKAGSCDIWAGPNEVRVMASPKCLRNKAFLYQVSFTFATEGYQPMRSLETLYMTKLSSTTCGFMSKTKQCHLWLTSYLNVFPYTRRYRRMNSISRLCLFFQSNIFFPILGHDWWINYYDSYRMSHTDSPVSKMLQHRKQQW